jgi:N utilization substance protein B
VTTPSPKPKAVRKPARSARRRARELALQGLYQWQMTRADPAWVQAHAQEHDEFSKCDADFFSTLLLGCIEQSAQLDVRIAPHLDRAVAELSPVEHAILWIGTYELLHCPDVPYKVVINEGVELAKAFGGVDGHKYVNGVLDHLALELRPAEVATAARPPAA